MKSSFEEGYNAFIEISGNTYGVKRASGYVARVSGACDELQNNLNKFHGFTTNIKQLKGDIQEFRSSGTFNIAAALNDSKYKTVVDRSHGYASPDITTNWGENYGLKALFSGAASAKAQSISHFQRYMEYKAKSGRIDLLFEDFITEKGLDAFEILKSDPIYSDQMRLIPEDQLKEAISYLKRRIAVRAITNPDEVSRYQETLNRLTSKIIAPDGSESSTATTQQLLDIAEKAKKGEYDAARDGFSTEELIKIDHILKQGVKAGITAATISLVLKVAPELYKCLDELLSNGTIDEEELKSIGFATLEGSTEGFIRGFVSATIMTSCTSGFWGEALKSATPEVIGGMTVILMNTLKDSFLLAKGDITQNDFTYNLQRNIFVTGCGLGGGVLLQSCLPMIPFAYLLGNFVGSMVGSFAFVAYEQAILSYCISSGSTFFGLVDQNYKLPDDVLKELGVNLFAYEKYTSNESSVSTYTPSQYEPNLYNASMVKILRRGVISVRQVGYI